MLARVTSKTAESNLGYPVPDALILLDIRARKLGMRILVGVHDFVLRHSDVPHHCRRFSSWHEIAPVIHAAEVYMVYMQGWE